jgi:hypothetical protein
MGGIPERKGAGRAAGLLSFSIDALGIHYESHVKFLANSTSVERF